MMLLEQRERVPVLRNHWGGEEIEEFDTTVAAVPVLLPSFDRIPFGRHRLKDVIVRAGDCTPVAVVSKSYLLIQHLEVVEAIRSAVARDGIDAGALRAHLTISEYGTRMGLRVLLSEDFGSSSADGFRMALTFECFNSVDGTVPLFALVGWFRFVCSNGLAVGTACARYRQRHVPVRQPAEFPRVLSEGLEAARRDITTFESWMAARIDRRGLTTWVDGALAREWGTAAAARVYSIATTGYDGVARPVFRRIPAHERTIKTTVSVPGSEPPCGNRYAAAQALAWVASRRSNVAKRSEWRAQIGDLIDALPTVDAAPAARRR